MKAHELNAIAKPPWDAMTNAERTERTADALRFLTERKEMKKMAPHNVPLAAYNDAKASINKMIEQVCYFSLESRLTTDPLPVSLDEGTPLAYED